MSYRAIRVPLCAGPLVAVLVVGLAHADDPPKAPDAEEEHRRRDEEIEQQACVPAA